MWPVKPTGSSALPNAVSSSPIRGSLRLLRDARDQWVPDVVMSEHLRLSGCVLEVEGGFSEALSRLTFCDHDRNGSSVPTPRPQRFPKNPTKVPVYERAEGQAGASGVFFGMGSSKRRILMLSCPWPPLPPPPARHAFKAIHHQPHHWASPGRRHASAASCDLAGVEASGHGARVQEATARRRSWRSVYLSTLLSPKFRVWREA